jgi:hypothetical protein
MLFYAWILGLLIAIAALFFAPLLSLLLWIGLVATVVVAAVPQIGRAIREGGDPSRPIRRQVPAKPSPPTKPKARDSVIVRAYKEDGRNSEQKVAAAYEKDARLLVAQGYEPVINSAQGPKPATLLLGGIGLWASGTLTVTYRLSPAAQAEEGSAQKRWEDAMQRFAIELASWRALESAAVRDHAAALQGWREQRAINERPTPKSR